MMKRGLRKPRKQSNLLLFGLALIISLGAYKVISFWSITQENVADYEELKTLGIQFSKPRVNPQIPQQQAPIDQMDQVSMQKAEFDSNPSVGLGEFDSLSAKDKNQLPFSAHARANPVMKSQTSAMSGTWGVDVQTSGDPQANNQEDTKTGRQVLSGVREGITVIKDMVLQEDGTVKPVVDLDTGGPPSDFVDDGIPKVAIMFLLNYRLHHEYTWRAWFTAAASLRLKTPPPRRPDVPISTTIKGDLHPALPLITPPYTLQSPVDKPDSKISDKLMISYVEKENRDYFSIAHARALYQRQQLFTVYVHMPPGRFLPNDSIFSGREVKTRVDSVYAQHSLIDAEYELLYEAVKHPLNEKFILVSDSCIPMYPPESFYLQLLYESKSRINACDTSKYYQDNLYRWRNFFSTTVLKQVHWRKSSQWFGIDRQLVKLILSEQHVDRVFRRFCFTLHNAALYHCVSDEHYLPTMLASYGLDHMTDCSGKVVHAYWKGFQWSPVTYKARNVSQELLGSLKQCKNLCRGNDSRVTCDSSASINSARSYFTYSQQRLLIDEDRQKDLNQGNEYINSAGGAGTHHNDTEQEEYDYEKQDTSLKEQAAGVRRGDMDSDGGTVSDGTDEHVDEDDSEEGTEEDEDATSEGVGVTDDDSGEGGEGADGVARIMNKRRSVIQKGQAAGGKRGRALQEVVEDLEDRGVVNVDVEVLMDRERPLGGLGREGVCKGVGRCAGRGGRRVLEQDGEEGGEDGGDEEDGEEGEEVQDGEGGAEELEAQEKMMKQKLYEQQYEQIQRMVQESTQAWQGIPAAKLEMYTPQKPATLEEYDVLREKYFYNYKPIDNPCPLLGRKFPSTTSGRVLQVSLECEGTALGPECYQSYYG